jgi:IPT/TIG domain
MRRYDFLAFLMTLASIVGLVQLANAGGPKYVAGVSYFNSGSAGTPLTWAQGQVNYYTDQGDLSPILPGPSADAFVADAFSQWTSISTAAVAAIHGGQLAEDVSGSNVYVNPDGTITMPADIEPSATDKPVGVVYDYDGTVTDALLGQGAGDPSECFYNAAYGGVDNFGTNTYFLHALVVINGMCALNNNQLTDVEYRLVRVLGQVLGLGWSQVNDNVLTGNPHPTQADYAGFPVMHSIDPPNCIPITLCYPNPYQPKMDDQASISRLYPVTAANQSQFPGKQIFSTNTVRIYGSVYFTDSSGQSAQAMQGVNVIARWIDTSTGLPSRQYAASSVSGFLFVGNAGNMVTGFNDSSGLPLNRFGSNDTLLEGFFDLAGLQIPNGGTSAQFQLTVEAIDPMWSTPVQPYGPWQVNPSGSIQPILVNVTLGGDVEQDVLMQDSAVQKQAPFPPTSYSEPAAVPIGGDWESSLSPYGDLDYFWFNGQANRTLSVLVTALDETGAPSESKAQPVIGMWDLSDPGSSPAPANTSSPFNSSTFGMTILNAQLEQATGFRIGISDLRGDGRPDYFYHARILYGDKVTPARASVAGGTPLTLSGLGFESNLRVTVNDLAAPPLSVSANQILLNAPPQPDGLNNLALTDPPTLASSVLTGAVTYGAGPNDTLKLIAGTNPWTPVGGQAPNPITVQAFASDGTPVPGASIFFTASPAVSFSACGGGNGCTVLTDDTGQASSFMTVLTAGVSTITAQLAPASYQSPQQVQTTLAGESSALDIGLAPQYTHILQNTAANIMLTARALSNGAPLSGQTINFMVMKGSATANPPSATTNSNGYAQSTLQISQMTGDVQVSVCVGPNNNPCQTFYGTAVPGSGLQIQPVAGIVQMAPVGQSLQPVVVRVSDLSQPPNPVVGANVLEQWSVELPASPSPPIPGGDTGIGGSPMPIVLYSSQAWVATDANGLATFQPSTGGFGGAIEILGTAAAGSGNIPFALEWLPPISD